MMALTLGMPSATVVVWSKICFHSSCSVHTLFVKSMMPLIPIMLPWVNYAKYNVYIFLHHCIQKLG